MIKIYPEQLATQLNEKLLSCYLLLGNEPLLLQECQDVIRACAAGQQFSEHTRITLESSTDWDDIFRRCQTLSLFTLRQTLTLILPENGPTALMEQQLAMLSTLLHSDILLILQGNELTKSQENSSWYKAFSQNAALIPCTTPEPAQLPRWINARARRLDLELDDAACQLLCYCYEGNLLALVQVLEQLSLLWPNSKLTLPRVEQMVNDAAHFTPWHWVDALLAGKSKRALHILHQLKNENSESIPLIRHLQRDLLVLLTLQRRQHHTPLRTLFDQQRIWQNRRALFSAALQRLSADQLYQAVYLLTRLELTIKEDYGQNVWPELETLSLLLCNKELPVMANNEL